MHKYQTKRESHIPSFKIKSNVFHLSLHNLLVVTYKQVQRILSEPISKVVLIISYQ